MCRRISLKRRPQAPNASPPAAPARAGFLVLTALLTAAGLSGLGPDVWARRAPKEKKAAAPAPAPKEKRPSNTPPKPTAPDLSLPATPLTRQYSFGLYDISYRAQPAPGSTAQAIRAADGSSLLSHLPLSGAGPWMDSGQSAMHRQSFADMTRSGINVALVRYPTDKPSRRDWGQRNLDMAAQGIRELHSEGKPAPSLAPYLDFNANTRWNLSRPWDRIAFYTTVREFYRRVPLKSRALVSLPNGGEMPTAYPVFFGEPSGLTGISAEFVTEFRKWFEKEFAHPVALAGEAGWKELAPNLDAYFVMEPAKPLGQDDTGPLHTATLTPSYNERGILGENVPIRARMNGRPYVAAWNDVGQQNPDWVLLNSWNGWREGTELSPSRESGDRDLNLTRAALAHLDSNAGFRARLLGESVPPGVQPGALVRMEFRIENAGVQTWPMNQSRLRYQWMRDGREVASGDTAVDETVRPREEHTAGVLVPALSGGEPLAEGDYELRFTLNVPGLDGGAPGNVSLGAYAVRVGARPDMAATLLESGMPLVIQPGTPYKAHVRIRNDGKEPWSQVDHYISYRWRRVSDNSPDSGDLPKDLPAFNDAANARTPLKVDVAPGALADLDATVAASDGDGKPLPVWTPESGWHYELEWTVAGPGGEALTRAPEAVEVVGRDPGVDFPLGSGLPKEMNADSPYDVKVVVKNVGPAKWTPGQVKLACRWYYWDGVPMNWGSQPVPVTGPLGDLSPGEQALVRIPVQSPPIGGLFLVAVEANVDGAWATTLPTSRGAVVAPESIQVRGGGLQPLALTEMYNFDGISPDAVPTDGNFDGKGNSFPGQLLPPLVTPESIRSTLYPSNYMGPVKGVGLDADRRVPFDLPVKSDGGNNMVLCSAQNIRLRIPRCAGIHMLMASDGDADPEFRLTFEDGTTRNARVNMTSWDRAPAFEHETVGYFTPVRNTPSGVERHDTYLKQYFIPLENKPTLTQIDLPNDTRVKVVAITVESW